MSIGDGVQSIGAGAFSQCSSLTPLSLPDSLTSIGEYAFSGCSGLASLTIPDGITSIARGTFESCHSLSQVVIPDSVTSIGSSAFTGCTALDEISISSSITSIGSNAFRNCGLMRVTLNEGLTSIGSDAFSDNPELAVIIVPATVTELGSNAFGEHLGQTTVMVAEGNGHYSTIDGVLFNADRSTLIRYPVGRAGEYELPATVTEIAAAAFLDCSDLTGVTLPAGLASIGDSAFFGCTGLGSITIPDGVARLGASAFQGCSALIGISIPESVAEIGGACFEGCTELASVTIEDGATSGSISYGAFQNCTSLTGIAIPSRVVEIGAGLFQGCTSLTNATLPDGLIEIRENTFGNCTSLLTMVIPSGVMSIGDGAFQNATSLTSIIIPQRVKRIGYAAFMNCTSLTDIAIPGSVIEVGGGAFEACTDLESVSLAEGLKTLGWSGFAGCTSLQAISIPASTVEIGSEIFDGCISLAEIEVDPENQSYLSHGGVLFDKEMGTLIRCPEGKGGDFDIPAGVTDILGKFRWWGFFGSGAFENCRLLTEATIPEGVTQIGSFAFPGCASLPGISIPSSVESIGSNVFDGCRLLGAINVAEANSSYVSPEGVLFDQEMTRLIKFPEAKTGNYVIPEGVLAVNSTAFQSCARLSSLAVPASVEPMSGNFYACPSLTSISVDPANLNFASSEGVLFDKGMTQLIRYPENKSGESYTIPTGVASILGGEGISDMGYAYFSGVGGAFEGCHQLGNVFLASTLSDIGTNAFRNCSTLSRAVFLGDAPWMARQVFDETAGDFTVYYLSCNRGFSSPTWEGYPASMLEEAGCPAASWLVGHGLDYDTALHHDLNGDGVSLLMAYALNLDPHQNLRASLPQPQLDRESLSLSFHAASRGVTYTVETSTDLKHWTREGVSLFDSGNPQLRKASVETRAAEARFLRLVVEGAPAVR